MRADAAVDFEFDRAVADHRFDAADFFDHRRDEGLAAKTRIDRHHQDEVEPVEHILDSAFRRRGIEGDPGLLAKVANSLQRAVEMLAGLRMNRHAVSAGLGESFEIGVGGRDHQMDVERLGREGAKALDRPPDRRKCWERNGRP